MGCAYALSFGTPAHAVADAWAGVVSSSKACLTGSKAAHVLGSAGNGHKQQAAPPPPPDRTESFAHVAASDSLFANVPAAHT